MPRFGIRPLIHAFAGQASPIAGNYPTRIVTPAVLQPNRKLD